MWKLWNVEDYNNNKTNMKDTVKIAENYVILLAGHDQKVHKNS